MRGLAYNAKVCCCESTGFTHLSGLAEMSTLYLLSLYLFFPKTLDSEPAITAITEAIITQTRHAPNSNRNKQILYPANRDTFIETNAHFLNSVYPHFPHERLSLCSARKTPSPHFTQIFLSLSNLSPSIL